MVKSQEEEIKLLKESLKSAEVGGDRAEMKVAELMNQAKIQLEVGQEGVEQKDEKAEKDKPKKDKSKKAKKEWTIETQQHAS